MKKKMIILIIILMTFATAITQYQRYIRSEAEDFLFLMTKFDEYSNIGLTGDIVLKRIVKSSRKELVMLVDWGEDLVFMSAMNWRGRAHLELEVKVFEKGRGVGIIE